MKLLLKHDAEPNAQDDYGVTALMLAISARCDDEHKDIDIVEALLNAETDTNLQDSQGKTALMYGARSNLVDQAELLIQHKADVNMKDFKGKTALTHTLEARYDYDSMISLLKRNRAKQ